jgi:hypothetical protein
MKYNFLSNHRSSYTLIGIMVISGVKKMDVFHIGPLNINYEWLYALVAGTLVYFVSEGITQKHPKFQKKYLDTLVNCMMTWLFSAKLSVFFFRPSLLWENPLGILYFWDGVRGIITATIITLFYLFWKARSENWPQLLFRKVFVYGIVTFLITFVGLRTLFQLAL